MYALADLVGTATIATRLILFTARKFTLMYSIVQITGILDARSLSQSLTISLIGRVDVSGAGNIFQKEILNYENTS